jgi:hypothetical protein
LIGFFPRSNRMTLNAKNLIPAVVSYLSDRGVSVSKTKLLKLLYLLDVEYYRQHRKLFTGFDWKFFHLGPWTREFETVLSDLLNRGVLAERPYETPEFESSLLHAEEHVDLRDVVPEPMNALLLQRVLNDWGTRSTVEILDHVYFRTEPMEHGIRNERLEFSWIPEEQPEMYRRRSSQAPPGHLAKKKREYQKRLAELADRPDFQFTEPQYDDQYFDALNTMERMRGL